MTCAIITEPDTGETFTIPSGETAALVPVSVQTLAGVSVVLLVDGLPWGSPVTADGEGVALFNPYLEEGGHSFQARTGSGDEEMDSEIVNVTVEPTDTRPPLVPDMNLRWYLNWIANTFDTSVTPPVPLYTTAEAAAYWAGISLDQSLASALNKILGNLPGHWVSVNIALNQIAGTTGLSNVLAAYAIAQAM
jgi:hypothetical protein